MQPSDNVDYKKVLESAPGCYLVLLPNTPEFTIVAVTDSYAEATNTKREEILNRGLFEVFPDDPNDPGANGVQNLTASLNRVLANKKIDVMDVQKYNIPRSTKDGGGFEERYWSPNNSPVLDSEGNVIFIIHCVIDVTKYEKLLLEYGGLSAKVKDVIDQLTQRLLDKIDELEKASKLMVGRELKMAEQKRELEALRAQSIKDITPS